jgi:hypothetical protein
MLLGYWFNANGSMEPMDILKQFPGRYLTVADLEELGGEFTGTVVQVVSEDMKNNVG